MRITTSIAATAVAVLALTLTGCGDDGDGKSAAPTKDDKGASQSTDAGKPTPSGTGGSGNMKSSSPTPSKTPGKTATPLPGRSTTSAPTKAPVPSRTSVAPPTASGQLASAQGTWYFRMRDANGNLLTLRVNGTSMALTGPDKTCPGTLTSAMAASFTCAGKTLNGTARVSGRTLSLTWTDGTTDQFSRTKP
ncbi:MULTISPECIES: hypothetical protein [Streptomyces]|uniref:Lipoprotein n=1 Tax=Streptomyces lonegramiae TaxID=3075524 RepID=A0ABU2XU79_9ACTN|nr:hypothetical protein [Streptomyces sp. DSM 41529]MDT0549474.1 hypothetical protein [Streptomyces sp. DSM 41529]